MGVPVAWMHFLHFLLILHAALYLCGVAPLVTPQYQRPPVRYWVARVHTTPAMFSLVPLDHLRRFLL